MSRLQFGSLWFVSIVIGLLVKQIVRTHWSPPSASVTQITVFRALSWREAARYNGVLAWLAPFHHPCASRFPAERQFCLPRRNIFIATRRNKPPSVPSISVCIFLGDTGACGTAGSAKASTVQCLPLVARASSMLRPEASKFLIHCWRRPRPPCQVN